MTKEGARAVKTTRLSCHRSRSNELRLWLSATAYNLSNLCRRLALPRRINQWPLIRSQERLLKTGSPLIRHDQLLSAESHAARELFGVTVRRISA